MRKLSEETVNQYYLFLQDFKESCNGTLFYANDIIKRHSVQLHVIKAMKNLGIIKRIGKDVSGAVSSYTWESRKVDLELAKDVLIETNSICNMIQKNCLNKRRIKIQDLLDQIKELTNIKE